MLNDPIESFVTGITNTVGGIKNLHEFVKGFVDDITELGLPILPALPTPRELFGMLREGLKPK